MAGGHGFTLEELAMLVIGGVAALALTLAGLDGLGLFRTSHRPRPSMVNNTHLRGIHQGMVIYAQGNNGNFPGLDAANRLVAPTVEDRYHILLDASYFTGAYAISPYETKMEWHAGPVTRDNYSYAMLQIYGNADGRRREWYETLNTQAIVMSDRNIGSDGSDANVQSIRPTSTPGNWRGAVVYNDNRTSTENTHRFTTRYGSTLHADDNLFEPAGPDDAYLIHTGQ